MDIAEFRAELHGVARRAPRRARAAVRSARNARRAHRADAAGEVDPLRRGLDALGLARARRRAAAARRCCGPSSARRSRRATSPTRASTRSIEVLAPTLIDFAPPELAAEVVPRLLSGDEIWCQGFSEPDTGQRPGVAALPRRARRRRRRTASTLGDQRPEGVDQPGPVLRPLRAAHAHRDRPSRATAASPRSSSTWTRPGITVAPIEMINGEREFAEVFFDDVVVPADRMLGEVNGGWAVAMSILPYERSSCFWQRIAYLYRRLQLLVDVAPRRRPRRRGRGRRVPAAARAPRPLARDAAPARRRAARSARRRRSTRCSSRPPSRRSTTPSAGSCPGSSSSTTAPAGEAWRSEYLYSRAATIYGGTAEVQRNIIARRLLDLGSDE